MLNLLVSLSRVPASPSSRRRDPRVDARTDLAETSQKCHPARAPRLGVGELLLEESAGDVVGADGERLVRDAEGNPLMLLQLARHVAEGGDPEKLPAGSGGTPGSVETLSAEERAVAERGAVMGREFWDSGVEALCT